MKKINKGDLIKLENNKEYVCFFELEDSGINYLYLVTETKPVEVKFAKYNLSNDNDSITLIGSKKEKEYVLELFKKHMSELN